MLPLEPAGRDLSGEILRRVEAKQRADGGAKVGGSAGIGEITPRLPVFGSRRSWIWATLAVAAGLMIMVLDRDEKGKQLPPVAQNDGASAKLSSHDRAEPVGGQTNMPAIGGGGDASKMVSLGTPTPDSVGAPNSAAAAPRESDKLASREPSVAPPSGGVAASNTTSDRLAVSTPAEDRRKSPVAVGGGLRQRADVPLSADGEAKSVIVGRSESKATPLQERAAGESGIASERPADLDNSGGGQAEIEDTSALVVVHVSAKPAAIRGGEFEKLLARNGVEFDEKGKAEEATATADSIKKAVARSPESYDASRDKSGTNKPVDMVVVDAPRDVVAACMADLQHDESNFASVEVDQPSANDRASAATTDVAKQLGSELRQYNRGMTTVKQPPGTRFYADDAANKDRGQLNDESKLLEGISGGQPPQGNQQVQNQRAAQVNRGRALRVQAGRDEDQTSRDSQFGRRAGGFGGGESESLRRSVAQQQKPQNENSDEVRVLFMLSREATSPAPSKKAAE